MKKGYTLIELLVVVTVLAILMTIVAYAVGGSITSAYNTRTETNRALLEQAIQQYYARRGEWPGPIESAAQNAQSRAWTGTATDAIFSPILVESYGSDGRANPLIDVSGLFVCPLGQAEGRGSGMEFQKAVKPGKKGKRYGAGDLAVGWGNTCRCVNCKKKEKYAFYRFMVQYDATTDEVKVTKPHVPGCAAQ